MSALDFEDVHASYGPYKALNGLTLSVGDAENVALLGRNGVGKSTLVRVASGIVPVASGSLLVLGRRIRRTAPHVLARDGVRPGGHWGLYNLVIDPSEQHDLSAEHPELVEKLSKTFLDEAHRTFVLPMP